MVTASELEALVKAHGWRVEWEKRYKTRYAYAARGSRKTKIKTYLCGEHGLSEITPEDIVKKLQ